MARATLYARAIEQVNRIVVLANGSTEHVEPDVLSAAINVVRASYQAMDAHLEHVGDAEMLIQADLVSFVEKVIRFLVRKGVHWAKSRDLSRSMSGGKSAFRFKQMLDLAVSMELIAEFEDPYKKGGAPFYGIPMKAEEGEGEKIHTRSDENQ